jgi:hypothetical protein
LHSYGELFVVPLQGFGIALLRPCGNAQAVTGLIHDLVMTGIYQMWSWTDCLRQPGSGLDTDGMSFVHAGLAMPFHVLRDRPSVDYVEQLHAAANCQHRQVLIEGRFEQSLFHGIPLVIGLVVCFVRFLTKELGVHVSSAREQQAIQSFDGL